MNLRDWTFLIAAACHLALAFASMSRAGKSTLGLPLALLSFDMFGWTFAAFANHQLGHPLWRSVDVVFTALAPAVVFHVVLTFVGKKRRYLGAFRATYVFFAALALVSAASVVSAWGRAFVESNTWNAIFLLGWVPTLAFELWLLWRHLRDGRDAEEQARTRIVLAALAFGGACASTGLWSDIHALPGLAPLGTLVSTALLATAALRFRLFDRNIGSTTSLYAFSIAVAAVLVYLTLFQGLRGNLPALTFGVTVVTLGLSAIVREATTSIMTYRERVERLAVLGRFSAQMAHDLKNPLAALVGAVQVLEAQGEPTGDAHEFRKLIVDQAERIRTIVDKYDRLGRVEPVRTVVDVNRLVERVATAARHASSAPVRLRFELDPSVGDGDLDPDLLSGALENIVRNALEAMPEGGTLVVRTRREHDGAGATLRILVEDDGIGMDARQAERAFDDFYTTKATGSGLGLPFVRRVALAHGGDVTVASKQNAGTTIDIRLPIA